MSSRHEKDRLDAWLTRENPDDAGVPCRHCGAPIWPEHHEGDTYWVDSSDGDGCWEVHTTHEPIEEVEIDMPDPCERCDQIGVHDAECPARPFPFVVTTQRHHSMLDRMSGGIEVRFANTGDLLLASMVDNTTCAEALRNLVLYAHTADSLGRMADTLTTLARRLAYQEGIQSTHTTEEQGAVTITNTETDFIGRILAIAAAENDPTMLRNMLRNMGDAWRADVALAAQKMNDEARRRGWCSEYEDYVDRINNDLHIPWPPRNRTYDVTGSFTITITRQVQAEDDDAACNSIGFGGWYSEQIAAALRNGECNWTFDDVEAEEADG